MRVLWSTLLLLQAVLTTQQDILCCKQAVGFRQCRSTCTKFLDKTDVTLRFSNLKRLPKDCPGHLTGLWRCLNATNPVLYEFLSAKIPNKAGPCCLLTSSSKCRKDCLDGNISYSKNTSCGPITDKYHESLRSCVTRHNATAHCCHGASRSCIKACKLSFASEKEPKLSIKRKVKNNCARHKQVLKCMEKLGVHLDSQKQQGSQLKCCSRAKDTRCKERCRKELLSNTSINKAIAGITSACKGPYEAQENKEMWSCFLITDPPISTPPIKDGPPVREMDAAKLQCCSKAVSSDCWRLCVKMFSSSWSGSQIYPDFDMQCTYQPSEVNLMNCLADVTKPCQLGCSGLNFCTNFNNRHTELFRSCNAKSDLYAKSHMQQWHEGIIKVPGMPIVVQDIKTCLPDTWKAIACLLQIKPCSIKSHRSTICKSDCIHILQTCGNSSSYTSKKSVESVCDKLSPSDTNCISITKYLIPSKYKDVTDEVTHPCNPNPCHKSKICDINRTCYAAQLDRCEPHSCVRGCPLGEASTFLVRVGEYARVPSESGRDGCFRVCHCGTDGKLSRCTLLNCINKKFCDVKGETVSRSHGEHFTIGCNFCACFSGELMCTKRQCLEPSQIPDSEPGRPKRNHTPMFTGLPCGCSGDHLPICATNGHTYPNLCIARCSGFKDSQLEKGSCEAIDPCKKKPCKKRQRCVIDRKTCLTPHDRCDQYICVAKSHHHCKEFVQLEPVCDSKGVQHPNQCALQMRGKKHAYKGFCKHHCKYPTQSLCGVNGETYSSECAVQSSRVLVDYKGPCKAVGFGPGFGDTGRCSNVKCSPLVPSNCVGVHPPGACCPHCAAQIRILVSLTQLDINNEALKDNHGPATLDHLLIALRRHVTTTECDLFGYQSIEGDVVILIKAITEKPTTLQIEACSLEAQKIEALINTESPSFTSHVILSTLKGAQTLTPRLVAKVQGSSRHLMSIQNLILALVQTYLVIKWTIRS